MWILILVLVSVGLFFVSGVLMVSLGNDRPAAALLDVLGAHCAD